MTLEEYIEERRKRVDNMTLAQARDLIAKTLSHSDMEIEFDKAVWMLLNCADEKINSGWIPVTERLPDREEYIANNGRFIVSDGERSYSEYFDIYDKKCFGEPTMYGFRVDRVVAAWMPLPQPYVAESENT
jgi:hypothetical protein